MAELFKFMKACLTELIPSKENYKLSGDFWLDDSHAHYFPVKNRAELEGLLGNMTSKLGRTAITDWGENVGKVLKYNDFVKILNSTSSRDFEISDRGPVSRISYKGNITEIYHSQEIRTKSHLHITAEGCLDCIPEDLDPRKTVEIIHEKGGIALVEHPTTKCHPILQYTHTTEEEDKLTLEVFDMADAAEAFNSFNTLWMFRQNAKAKKLIEKHGKIAGIAGSDSHYGLAGKLTRSLFYKNMGRTGIYLPQHDNSSLTGIEIIQQKKNDLKNKNYMTLENYTGPLTFSMSMIPPIVARKLGIDEDSIS
jgi:hypothetical protein